MARDFEREEHEYRPGLRFRSMRFLSDTEIELDYEGIGTDDRTFRATYVPGEIPLVQMDEQFIRLYRGVPCLSVGHSVTPMVMQAFHVRRDQLPADSEWERLDAECRGSVKRSWDESQTTRRRS